MYDAFCHIIRLSKMCLQVKMQIDEGETEGSCQVSSEKMSDLVYSEQVYAGFRRSLESQAREQTLYNFTDCEPF